MECVADEAIMNELHPCQGIASHICFVPCFEPEIATIAGRWLTNAADHSLNSAIDGWLLVG